MSLATALERLGREGKADEMDEEDILAELDEEYGARAEQLVASQNARYQEHAQQGEALIESFAAEWRELVEAGNAAATARGAAARDVETWFGWYLPDLDFTLEMKAPPRPYQRLERKADTQQLIAALQAKEQEAAAKDAEIREIITSYGLSEFDNSEILQRVIDKMQDDQIKAEKLEEEIESLAEEMQEIVADLEDAGLEYPFGLDLQYI